MERHSFKSCAFLLCMLIERCNDTIEHYTHRIYEALFWEDYTEALRLNAAMYKIIRLRDLYIKDKYGYNKNSRKSRY